MHYQQIDDFAEQRLSCDTWPNFFAISTRIARELLLSALAIAAERVMSQFRRVTQFFLVSLLFGCAEPPITTASIPKSITPNEAQLRLDTSKPPRVEPDRNLPPETKRAWCELRQRDIRAGRPPLGENAPKQIAAGNALCLQWFE
jgi:hypothetical protein